MDPNPNSTNSKPQPISGVATQVGVENGKVLIMFSQKLTVIGYSPEDARTLSKALKAHAIEAENMTRDNAL
jgi:hypothetical protein